jgi:DNA-binding IclR family transcriptional regulator
MIWGFMASQALHVAAKLAVFDELRGGPKTIREVAEATDSQEIPLRRLLRFLTTIDVVTQDEKGRFSSTAQGDCDLRLGFS